MSESKVKTIRKADVVVPLKPQMEQVPPVKALLEKGAPGVATLDEYIRDLDGQLENNSTQLDNCLRDILMTTNNLPGSRQWNNPRDSINQMLEGHILEKDSCYDPEAEDINTILSHVAGSLEHYPGYEEKIFQDLLSLSSAEGLSLPFKTLTSDPMASATSVNIAEDNMEQQITQQWDHIARHLRKYFTDQLQKLPVGSEKVPLDMYENKRFEFIQSLSTLYPSEDVLIKYQTLRAQQLEYCFQTLLPDADAENYNSMAVTRNCQELADIILKMIDEDFVIFNSGVFKKSFNIARAMHDMYLEKFSDEMSALVEDIWEEMEEILRKFPSQSSSDHSNLSNKAKLSRMPSKDSSHSMDSIVTVDSSSEGGARSFNLPRDYIESLINVIVSILHIEEHVESLLKCAAWDAVGVSTKKTRRKGSLRGVLKTSSSPEPVRRPLSFSGSEDMSFSDSLTSNLGSSLPGLTDSQPAPKGYRIEQMWDKISGVVVVEKTRAEERLRWEWKLMFKKISQDLSQCIDKHIRNALKTSLDKELKDWTELHVLVTEPINEDLWGGKLDYPKAVTKSVLMFMKELDFLLPFAKAGIDGILQCVKSSYTDAASLCLQNFHVHLTKLSGDVPKNAPMKSIYAILSSAAYIRNHLSHYESTLSADESSKKVFSMLHKQYVELVEALTKLTVEINNNFVGTSILHDTESYNWMDSKEFFEGERCAFPIQMWNYHMRGLLHDLWSICPPQLGQSIYSTVLHESLMILTQRYAHARPSYRRTPQFRSDVLTILLCASELLFPACDTVAKYLDVGHSQQPHYNIQNLCASLLSTMAVVSSPLDILYRVFKRGFYSKMDISPDGMTSPGSDVIGSNTDWLSWIRPALFMTGHKHYDDMRTTTAIYIHCKLLLHQPEMDWSMIMQALIMKDYTLPILFLTQSVLKSTSPSHKASSPKQEVPISSHDPSVKRVFQCVTSLLCQCSHFTDSIAKVIIPVIDRCDDWKMLDTKTIPGKDMPVPVWLNAVFNLMAPFTHRVIKPVLEYILMEADLLQPVRPVMSVLAELPCGCHPHNPQPPRPKKSGEKEMMDAALKMLINQMAEEVYVIPTHVCVLLKTLQDHCISQSIKTPHQCVGLKVLGTCLRSTLVDSALIESLTGITLNPTHKDMFNQLAECVYYVMVSTKAKSHASPKQAGRFCKENKEWVTEKIQSIGSYFNSETFDARDNSILERATNEFTTHLFDLIASNIMESSTGQTDMRGIYHLIDNNFDWLEKHLDIHVVLPHSSKNTNPEFTLSMKPKKIPDFDPIKEYDMIGPFKFDHATINEFPIDWMKLLQSDLGLSEFGFRTLLYNRHEMQDGAFLEENEKKPVEILKSVYENEPRELG